MRVSTRLPSQISSFLKSCLALAALVCGPIYGETPTPDPLTFSAIATGNWEDATTWNQDRAPTAGDDIATLAGNTVTINADAAIGAGGGDVFGIGNDSQLILAEGVSLTVNGNFVQDGYNSNVVLNANSAILFNPAAGQLFTYRRDLQRMTIRFNGRPNERARIGLAPTALGGYYIDSNGSRDQLLRGSYGRIEDSYNPDTDVGMQMTLNNTPGVSSLVADHVEFIRCGSIRVQGFGAGANTEVDIDAWTFREQRIFPGRAEPAFWFDGYGDVPVDITNPTLTTKSVTNIVSDTPINIRFVQGYTLDNFVLDSTPETANRGNARSSNAGGDALTHNRVFRADFNSEGLNLIASLHDTSYFYSEVENPHGWSTQQLRGDATVRNFWFESNREGQLDTGEAVLTNGPQLSVTLDPPGIAPVITLENSGTVGDSSNGAMHPALFAYNNSEGINLIANHNVARVQDDWHAIQIDEGEPTLAGAGVALTNNVFFGDAPNAGYAIGNAAGTTSANTDVFSTVDYNLYFNLKNTGPNGVDGTLGVHEAEFSSGNPIDQNSLIADPMFFDGGRNLASWDESLRGDGQPGNARHAIDEMKKRNDDSGFNSAYTVEALVEYVALGHAVTNPQAIGNDGLPMGQTTHLPPVAPVFVMQPADQSEAPGSTVTFTSEVTGNPAPTFQWFFDGEAITGATDSNLQLTNIMASDAGNYFVRASNSAGTKQSNDAALTVVEADTDGDSIADSIDNCTNQPNTNQIDSDGDGFGNRCDADLNNDCTVNIVDFSIFRSQYLSTGPLSDFNSDNIVNIVDFSIFRSLYLQPPGPSAAECTPQSQ